MSAILTVSVDGSGVLTYRLAKPEAKKLKAAAGLLSAIATALPESDKATAKTAMDGLNAVLTILGDEDVADDGEQPDGEDGE